MILHVVEYEIQSNSFSFDVYGCHTRTSASMKNLKTIEMENFLSVEKVILTLKDDLSTSGGSTSSETYQGVKIIKLYQSLTFLQVITKLTSIVYWLACMNDLRIAQLPHCLEGSSHSWMAKDL